MSLGNTYNNNQANTQKDQGITVYSGYSMANPDSKIDATRLAFRFWKSNLCVSIFPRKNTGNDEVVFDKDNGITIYLNHTKARILKHELEMFLKDPITYNGSGVPAGQCVITISNGSEYGKDNPVLTIRKLAEGGEVVSSFAYEFKKNYHYSIRGYDGKEYNTVYDDYQNIEIEQFITVLEQYYTAATTAVAFTVCDQLSYSQNRTDSKIEAIAQALGVELPNRSSAGANRSRFDSNTHFRNNTEGSLPNGGYSSSYNSGYKTGTMDDLD